MKPKEKVYSMYSVPKQFTFHLPTQLIQSRISCAAIEHDDKFDLNSKFKDYYSIIRFYFVHRFY
jgi:hypothetical protein